MALPVKTMLIFLVTCLLSTQNAFATTNHHHNNTLPFQQRNLNTITAIYNRNLYPTNLEFAVNGSSSVPPGLFSANATGRITPLGNFTGFKDSTEYFFALAPIPVAPDYAGFSKIQIVSFQSQCAEVAASVVYITSSVIHPGAPDDGRFIGTLKQIAFWEFDAEGAVLKYDAWIPNLRLFNDITSSGIGAAANLTTTQVQAATIQNLCGLVQQECTGNNTQYSTSTECVDVLSAKAFGDWDEVWQDSVVCRELHVILARVDPETHCPHLGPTGGGKCVDIGYNEGYFASDQALFGGSEGENFVCAPIK